MILTQFPDLKWLKSQAGSGFSDQKAVNGMRLSTPGWPTVILNTNTRHAIRDNIQGPLSIFTNLSGNGHVTVDRKRVSITPETFFISNSHQHYTLEIGNITSTETFNIHIGDHFSGKAIQSLNTTPEGLIENDTYSNSQPFGFYNRLSPSDKEFTDLILEIKAYGGDQLLLDEKLYQLISILLKKEKDLYSMTNNLPVIKSSTKDEILKRLVNVTDYLYSCYADNPGLDELAHISCLSKFHFLRLFKLAYGQTPHQFITTLKIRKAKEMLKGSLEIGMIAHQTGFDTTSTFSRMFQNQTGASPSQFRAAVK